LQGTLLEKSVVVTLYRVIKELFGFFEAYYEHNFGQICFFALGGLKAAVR